MEKDYRTSGFTPKGTSVEGTINIYNDEPLKQVNVLNYESPQKKKQNKNIRINKKRMATALLVGVILVGSIKEGSEFATDMIKGIYNERNINLEPTYKIEYQINYGETLSGIASKYKDDQKAILMEVDKICRENNITNANQVPEYKVINLNVTKEAAEKLGYEFFLTKATEWEKKDHFLNMVNENKEKLPTYTHDSYKAVYVGTNEKSSIISQIDDKTKLLNELKLLNDPDTVQIASLTNEINILYDKAVILSENISNKEYGKDYYIEEIPVIVFKEENKYTL